MDAWVDGPQCFARTHERHYLPNLAFPNRTPDGLRQPFSKHRDIRRYNLLLATSSTLATLASQLSMKFQVILTPLHMDMMALLYDSQSRLGECQFLESKLGEPPTCHSSITGL